MSAATTIKCSASYLVSRPFSFIRFATIAVSESYLRCKASDSFWKEIDFISYTQKGRRKRHDTIAFHEPFNERSLHSSMCQFRVKLSAIFNAEMLIGKKVKDDAE